MAALAAEFQAEKVNLHTEYVSSPMKAKHCTFQVKGIQQNRWLSSSQGTDTPFQGSVLSLAIGKVGTQRWDHQRNLGDRKSLLLWPFLSLWPFATWVHGESVCLGKEDDQSHRMGLLVYLIFEAFSGTNDHWWSFQEFPLHISSQVSWSCQSSALGLSKSLTSETNLLATAHEPA